MPGKKTRFWTVSPSAHSVSDCARARVLWDACINATSSPRVYAHTLQVLDRLLGGGECVNARGGRHAHT